MAFKIYVTAPLVHSSPLTPIFPADFVLNIWLLKAQPTVGRLEPGESREVLGIAECLYLNPHYG